LASTRIRERVLEKTNEILLKDDTKRLGSFQDVPSQAGEIPHLRDLTPSREKPPSRPRRLKGGLSLSGKTDRR